MNLLKFHEMGGDIYINADKITAVAPSGMCSAKIYTTGGEDFIVKGGADATARYIMTSCVDDTVGLSERATTALEKRCGLCSHYEIGETRQCRKRFENRSEDDKVCHFYEP